MNKLRIILIFSAILLLGCRTGELESITSIDEQTTPENIASNIPDVMKGIIRVKFTPETGDRMTIGGQSGKLRSGQSDIDEFLQQIGAKSMQRVFPPAGKYEERSRREGLHLWYDITFDETKPVTRAASDARTLRGVEIVEEVYRPAFPPIKMYAAETPGTRATDDNPFDDPQLTAQWHYHNRGTTPKSVAGADINLFNAWQIETGKPNVIVCIVDGGIDIDHADLKANLHINLAELNGTPGVDDDNNGYIDDIWGFNFVANNGKITAEFHGTHVSGTVAARNNNGIGVAGVAGGDGSAGSGIRLMSAQIFQGESGSGNSAAAIKYGADNGAVISQNSWGYKYPGPGNIPSSDKAAIDYFIKYAGCDNDGKQLPGSPMKGGVVIFAAGNDERDYKSYPAAYPPIVSVSAMAPDFKKAWYSNQGDWITIMAPGGDEFYSRGMVLSTVPSNQYAYLQGTSMACPHVSGIAALVVSKFGGQGFTNEDLKKQIVGALLPVDIDEVNPDFAGRLGRGYIDAYKALSVNENKAPQKVDAVSVAADYFSLGLTWKAVTDEDDGTASVYRLYYSGTKTLNAGNYKNAESVNVNGVASKAGETIFYLLKNLSQNTDYSFAIVAEDRWGLQSEPYFFTATTLHNRPPKLTRTGAETVRIAGSETAEVKIVVEEPDGQEWTHAIAGQKTGVTITREKDGIRLLFRATAPLGTHAIAITVTDILGASSSIDVPFEIYKNQPPRLIKEFQKMFVPINKSGLTIDLGEYFTDDDGHALTYTARFLEPSKLSGTIDGDKLALSPSALGIATIEISATDTQNATTRTILQFQIVKDELVYIIYPVPVTQILNVRLSDEVQKADITIYTTTGTRVHRQSVSITAPEQRLVQLNLSGLSGGTYVLHVDANGKTFRQSFIKQ